MKKSIMKKWVKALRSGEFEQVKYRLNENGKHCCLGVLCDLALVDGKVECNVNDENLTIYGAIGKHDVLPEEVMEWSGIKTNKGSLGCISLVLLNDHGTSFNEIANIIEKHYKEL